MAKSIAIFLRTLAVSARWVLSSISGMTNLYQRRAMICLSTSPRMPKHPRSKYKAGHAPSIVRDRTTWFRHRKPYVRLAHQSGITPDFRRKTCGNTLAKTQTHGHDTGDENAFLRQSSRRVWLVLRRPEARHDRAAQSSLPDKRIGRPLPDGWLRTVRRGHWLDGSSSDLLPLLWEAASIERRHPDQIGSGSEHPTVRRTSPFAIRVAIQVTFRLL